MGITQRRRLRQVVREAFLGLLFLLPVAAQADWLVLQTGLRIETKGPWTVKGKQVVYTSTDKVLRSMRLSEIDLPASTRASAVEPATTVLFSKNLKNGKSGSPRIAVKFLNV